MKVFLLSGALAGALVALSYGLALAETFPPAPVRAAAAGDLNERMRTLVQTQCSTCHTPSSPPEARPRFADVYDLPRTSLEDLASDLAFVVPGFPEASPLFQVLFSQHRQRQIGTGWISGEELLLVYDWIKGLPSKPACAASSSSEDLPEAGRGVLVVSLSHLAGGCRAAGRIAEWRALTDDLLAALAHKVPAVRRLDPNGLMLAVEGLAFDRLTGSDLEALRAMMASGMVPIDRLAAFILDRRLNVRDEVRPQIVALAHMAGPALNDERDIEVSLVSDVPKAKTGELLSLKVAVSAECHLTIVSIDTVGRALVLFPNEIEDDNRVRPGATREVPGTNAGYQVRFDKPGTETFVAVCQRGRTTLDGVKVDYEKQRFPVLGDWRGFLALMDERQAQIEKSQRSSEGRQSRRRGRNREADVKPPAAPLDPKPNSAGWAALQISVD